MHFIEFKEKLKNLPTFTLQDIRQIEPYFYRHQLNQWQEKGYITKLRRGYYLFTPDERKGEASLFAIANRLYAPSYISFEMALSYYNLIPETVYGITSATTRATRTFSTPLGSFIYHTIRPPLFFGYHVVQSRGEPTAKIAEIEKAVLDFLYINDHLQTAEDMSELRFNMEEFLSRADQKKLNTYLAVFNNRALAKRLDLLLHTD